MPFFVARLRRIALLVAASLALASIIFALVSWERWRYPELTAPARLISVLMPASATPREREARVEPQTAMIVARDLAQERAGG